MAERKGISDAERHEDLLEALKFYQKGLQIRLDINDDPLQLAFSYHNVGSVYNKLGEYELARQNHERAYQIRKETPDAPGTDIASSLVWIGNDLLALDEAYWDIALKVFNDSYNIRVEKLGTSHPEVAWSLISISNWYAKKKNYKEALNFAKQALRIREDALPASHSYIQQTKDLITQLEKNIVPEA